MIEGQAGSQRAITADPITSGVVNLEGLGGLLVAGAARCRRHQYDVLRLDRLRAITGDWVKLLRGCLVCVRSL